MTSDDIDVQFLPRGGLPQEEKDAWCQIIAAAVAQDNGSLSVVFKQTADAWLMESFHWFQAGSSAFQTAGAMASAPLRERALAALRDAGKPVVGTRSNGP